MAKLGFLDVLLDNRVSWTEANAINQAHESVTSLRAVDDVHNQAIFKLRIRMAQQEKDTARLYAVVRVLVEALRDSGSVDMSMLDERIEAALAELEPPEPVETSRSVGGDPYRSPSGDPSPPVPEVEVRCGRCGHAVPSSRTTITADGELCDSCFQRA